MDSSNAKYEITNLALVNGKFCPTILPRGNSFYRYRFNWKFSNGSMDEEQMLGVPPEHDGDT
jgi:hypothetical protein